MNEPPILPPPHSNHPTPLPPPPPPPRSHRRHPPPPRPPPPPPPPTPTTQQDHHHHQQQQQQQQQHERRQTPTMPTMARYYPLSVSRRDTQPVNLLQYAVDRACDPDVLTWIVHAAPRLASQVSGGLFVKVAYACVLFNNLILFFLARGLCRGTLFCRFVVVCVGFVAFERKNKISPASPFIVICVFPSRGRSQTTRILHCLANAARSG